jgi:hypothetical protein
MLRDFEPHDWKTDYFELPDTFVKFDATLSFPCCCCKHSAKEQTDDPCYRCGHNANSAAARRVAEPAPVKPAMCSGQGAEQYQALHDALVLAAANYALTIPDDA